MRNLNLTLIVGSLLALLLGYAANSEAAENLVERGKHLVEISGCHDCHTPLVPGPDGQPMPDMAHQLSGHPEGMPYPTWTPEDFQKRHALALAGPILTAQAGPWGTSFTTNLTPDKETGLGEWTEESFIQAIRSGKHQGQPNGRDILPLMPWHVYRNYSDDDLKAIWAYLRSIPPIKNKVPEPVPPKAPSFLPTMKQIIADPSPALKVKKSIESDLVKRGEKLAITLGCHDCHTPINLKDGLPLLDENGMPQMDTSRLLSGHPEGMSHPTWTPADIQQRHILTLIGSTLTAWPGPWGVSYSKNLTSDKETGLSAQWTEEMFIQAIRTGKDEGKADGRPILPPMPWQAYRSLSDDDFKALWAYLRSIPPVKNKVPDAVLAPPPPMMNK